MFMSLCKCSLCSHVAESNRFKLIQIDQVPCEVRVFCECACVRQKKKVRSGRGGGGQNEDGREK